MGSGQGLWRQKGVEDCASIGIPEFLRASNLQSSEHSESAGANTGSPVPLNTGLSEDDV